MAVATHLGGGNALIWSARVVRTSVRGMANSCAARDLEGHVVVRSGKDAECFRRFMFLKLNFPRGVDRELPVRDQRLNTATVTSDNLAAGTFRLFLGVPSGPGYNGFLTFRIFVFAVTVVRRNSSTQTHTKKTFWIIAIRFRKIQQVMRIHSHPEPFSLGITKLDVKGAMTYRSLEIKVVLFIPSIYLEAQVGKLLGQFHIHRFRRTPRSLKPALIKPWLFSDDL